MTGEPRTAALSGDAPQGPRVRDEEGADHDDESAVSDERPQYGGQDRSPDGGEGRGPERADGRPVLLRWLTENRADTRLPGPPHGRRYLAPFADVWDELREMIEAHPRWRVEHADETRGLMAATCRSRVFGFVDDLTVWVRLDADGLTEVALRSRARTGRGDFGVNRRRVERILERLDEAFERV